MAATILREWQHAGDSFQLTERDKKLSAKGRSLRLIAFAAALLDIPEQHLGVDDRRRATCRLLRTGCPTPTREKQIGARYGGTDRYAVRAMADG